jgi:hypothetical protein
MIKAESEKKTNSRARVSLFKKDKGKGIKDKPVVRDT